MKAKYVRLKAATHANPQDGKAWVRLAFFLSDHGARPIKILQAYETAQRLLPDEDLRGLIGFACVHAGEAERAVALFGELLQERPSPERHVGLAAAHRDLDQVELARAALHQALSLDPIYDEAYYLLAELDCTKNPREAETNYWKAIELDAADYRYWFGLGKCVVSVRYEPTDDELEQGVKALKRSLELEPENVWAHAYLGNALWRLGRIEDADASFQNMLALCQDKSWAQGIYERFTTSLANDGKQEPLNGDES